MSKAANKPESVGAILDRLLKRLEIDKKIDEGKALELWAGAAGPRLAAMTRAAAVIRGRLTVECRSPAWANECRMLKTKLVEKLNRELGREIVNDIVFKTGDFN
jgi:predicted nucleic acid-binding Zn ribbon protein